MDVIDYLNYVGCRIRVVPSQDCAMVYRVASNDVNRRHRFDYFASRAFHVIK